MADDENKIKKWIKKWQKDKGDIGAGEQNPQITRPEKNLQEAVDKGDIGAGEENPQITRPEKNLQEAEKTFKKERKTFKKRQRKLTKMKSLVIPCRPKT